MAGKFDIFHGFALGSLESLKTARKLGIPTILERSNAHTRFAYEMVETECRKLGVEMPGNHSHAFNAQVLRREEEEYDAADFLFCPSEFVARTFEERGFGREKLARFQYGFDEYVCYPPADRRGDKRGLTFLFAGECTPRKGLHYALDAWLRSSACNDGRIPCRRGFHSGVCRETLHPTFPPERELCLVIERTSPTSCGPAT